MKEKKYVFLYRELKNKILSGQYTTNQKLPSKRVLADRYGVSVITAEKALFLLIEEGYVTPKEKSGYFVSALELLPTEKAAQSATITLLPEESQTAPQFEYDLWFKTVRKVLLEQGKRLFIQSPNKGTVALRNALSQYLLRYRGMVADPRRIIIGSGSEQLYETVVKLLGRTVTYGIENPSYEKIEAVYKAEGASVKKLPMGKDGITRQALRTNDFGVLHVTPFQSYPSGVTASAAKRYEYIKWAKNEKFIVEDDFNSEFFLPGTPIESLFSMDQNQRVIYMNTFSKSISPAIRIGYLILPEALLSRYDELLGNFSCTVPVLDQYILAEFLQSGNFERHLNRIRRNMK
ncbi:MAG: PLP-dependent aminotransferase family protein [Clostridia bacterium]|nr:PLP-dependent aminotransferase family protein [Clostridia bacterium]